LGFLHRSSLENKLQATSDCSQTQMAHGQVQMAPEAVPKVRILAFSSRFQLFFRLETPRNLKWIFFTLYCLQKPSKNHWLQSSYPWSFTWCLDLSIYTISHYKTLKTPMEWKQNNMFLKPLTTSLSLNLFFFKCKEKY
jgi:hypothetical protein